MLVLLDVSALVGFETGGLVNIAKISWWSSAPSGGLDIIWDATSNVNCIYLRGSKWYIWFYAGTTSDR